MAVDPPRDRESADAVIEAAADVDAELAVRLEPAAGMHIDRAERPVEIHGNPPCVLPGKADVDRETAVHGEDVRDIQLAIEIELEDRHRAARVDEQLALGPHVEHRRQVTIHRDIDVEIEPRRSDIHHACGADIHAHSRHAKPEADVDIEAKGGVADRYPRRAMTGGEAEEVEFPADDGHDVVLPLRVLHTGTTVEEPADVGGVGHQRRVLADRVIVLVGGPGGVGLEAVEQGILERA